MSLMDVLFSMHMADILETVTVADEVRQALLAREGPYGEMLKVVELLESPVKGTPLGKVVRKLGLTVGQVRAIELQAFEWVNELANEIE
jgi:c-di-GMP phosphodiesterase